MKMRVKILGIAVVASLLIGAFSVSAYSEKYWFEVQNYLNGTTVFSLDNLSTNTKVKADTLNYDKSISSSKAKFTVNLYKNFINNYPVSTTANNTLYTLGFGTVPAGNYTLNITKNGSEGHWVNGEGTINQ
ncbi:hypothetical protein IDH44_09955 [Paenibacillus sp. IB182496]|uniref:Uncharacterized protein n=1 Tax=Paenibacillus sabuli TaxID=2772509 RepID=A0A927BSJ6_9BACL|nr:hypothetical protein [Paenibacillus sabuli]MBD2845512.1 hypothetical protein [Paenibacillus sabuli]